METIITFSVQKDENRIIVHLEADKERFKATVMPLLDVFLRTAPIIGAKIPVPFPTQPETDKENKPKETESKLAEA